MRTALVLGGAATVWADAAAALELGEFAGVVACNDAAAEWPGPLEAIVTLHGEKAPAWVRQRAINGYPPAPVISYTQPRPDQKPQAVATTTEWLFTGQTLTGSSGLFAVKVALVDLGFDKAVVCGIPLTVAGKHFFDATDWRAAMSYRQGWKQALPEIRDRVRSMGGWTEELLGKPTIEWLAQ